MKSKKDIEDRIKQVEHNIKEIERGYGKPCPKCGRRSELNTSDTIDILVHQYPHELEILKWVLEDSK